MTIRTITGTIEYADGAIPEFSRAEFTLNGVHIDAVTIAHSAVYTPLDATGDITIDLYPNEGGFGADRYNVDLVSYTDPSYAKERRRINLGKIYVEDVDGQVLQDLLALWTGPAAELSAAETAAVNAIAAAADAEAAALIADAARDEAVLYGGIDVDAFADLDALTSADVVVGAYVHVTNIDATYQAVSSGESFTTAGGLKVFVLPRADGVDARAFGVVGDGVRDDTSAIHNALASGAVVNGAGLTCAVTEVVVSANMGLRNITLKGTDNTKVPLRIGTVGGTTYTNTNIKLRDINITGIGSYAFVFSGAARFDINNIEVTGFTAVNDVFYLNRLYAGSIKNLRVLGGTICGAINSCFNFALGVNGMSLDGIYTSAFTKYGITITGACNSLTFNTPVLQGHSAAWNIVDAYGLTINSPYTENVVNPFIIGSGSFTPRAIKVQGSGYISANVTGHPFAADDNKVLVLANRGVSISFDCCIFDGVRSAVSGKRLASVNNDCVLELINPLTSSGDLTESVTAFLYKESTATGTAGYYVRDTGAITSGGNTEHTEVKRTNAGGNAHVIEYYNSASVLTTAAWSPPNNV